MQRPSAFFSLSPQKHIFSKKKPVGKSFLYFLKKNFSNFKEKELSYSFFKKVFLIFQERYIQNHGIVRTRSIFGTLAHLKLEAYLEPWCI